MIMRTGHAVTRSSASNTRRRYQEHHEAGGRYGFSFGEAARAKVFVDWLGSGRRVLDAGCRDGTLMRHYAKSNRVIGCDIDDNALRLSRRHLAIPVAACDLMTGLPFADAVFDAVVLGEVLEHVPAPAFVLGEVRRVLRPGGLFVGSVPNAYRLKNRVRFLLGRPFDSDPTHLRFFSPESLRAALQEAGFGEIDILFLESRYLWLRPSLFGNTMLWRATRR